MSRFLEKEFPCSTEGMVDAQAFLDRNCGEPKPAIVVDEIVSNIVRCSGATTFAISIGRTDSALTLVFSDDGSPFDPLREAASPDLGAPVEERAIGGLGIFMVRKMAKSVTYRREAERNILTVVM